MGNSAKSRRAKKNKDKKGSAGALARALRSQERKASRASGARRSKLSAEEKQQRKLLAEERQHQRMFAKRAQMEEETRGMRNKQLKLFRFRNLPEKTDPVSPGPGWELQKEQTDKTDRPAFHYSEAEKVIPFVISAVYFIYENDLSRTEHFQGYYQIGVPRDGHVQGFCMQRLPEEYQDERVIKKGVWYIEKIVMAAPHRGYPVDEKMRPAYTSKRSHMFADDNAQEDREVDETRMSVTESEPKQKQLKKRSKSSPVRPFTLEQILGLASVDQ